MLLNPRKKQSSSSVLNLTLLADPAIDESFADSAAGKRFTRKKNTSNEHGRNLRAHRPSDVSAAELQCLPKETPKAAKGPTASIKPQDLFLRITHTPTKSKNGYTPASSDRATESTYLKSRYETECNIGQGGGGRRECPLQLKEELQLKTSELMLLEDQVMRLKRDLGSKEQEYLKTSIKKEKEFQTEIARLGEELQLLRADLQERNAEVRQLRKGEAVLNREIKALKYDKLLLQKQLEEIYKKRLPKELKELMSFRELSLNKQVEELKARLEESKSDHEVKLEAEIHKLKHENSQRGESIKKLEVHCRMMGRRIIELQEQLKDKSQQFSKLYVSMRESNNDLKEQLKKARKENLKLIRLHSLNHGTAAFRPQGHHKKKHIHGNMRSSSEQSLSLSLSSNS